MSLTIYTTKDSWVDSIYGGTHGPDTDLHVRKSGSGYERFALIGFDISSLIGLTINSVTLYVYQNTATESQTNYIKRITDNSWTESGVTWTNRPGYTETNSTQLDSNAVGWRTANITNMLKDQTGSDFSVYIIPSDAGPGTDNLFDSREKTNDAYIVVDFSNPTNVYVNSSTGNDSNVGDSCVAGHPVQTFAKAYSLLNSGGTIHVCNSGADFSGETVTLNKSFSITVDGDGNFYMPQAS